jgi:hypothetical protein
MRIYQVHTFVADQNTEGRLEHRRWFQTKVPPYTGAVGYFGATATVRAGSQALKRSAPPRSAHCLRQE